MAKNKKDKAGRISLTFFGFVFLILLIAIVLFIINNGSTSDIVEIVGLKNVDGIRCMNIEEMSFIFEEVAPISYKNTIMAVFIDDELSSLTIVYEGQYVNTVEADRARDLAESRYNLTMTEEYEMDITDFSRNISVSDNMIYATITSVGNKNLNFKTAPLFMLNDIRSFPNSLQDMKMAYENMGFSCINN